VKQSKDAQRQFERECTKMNMNSNERLRPQLVAAANDVPVTFNKITNDIQHNNNLSAAIKQYEQFSRHMNKRFRSFV
jgi:hypothetical protein